MRLRTLLLSTSLTAFAMAPAAAEAPKVVTDMPPVHALVAQVMGDLGEPVLLLDRGADPHNFQLRPTQAQSLAQADAVIWVGPEMTPWMARAIDGLEVTAPAVELLHVDGVRQRDFAFGHSHDHDDDHGHDHDDGDAHDHGHDDDHGHSHDHGHDDDHAHGHNDDHGHDHGHHDEHAHDHDHGHDHGHDDAHDHDHAHDDDHDHDHGHDHAHDHAHDGLDPHAWLDPRNAAVWVGAIAGLLSEIDPDNAETFSANADAAIADIAALEEELRSILAPMGDTPIVVFHDAYGHFAHHFGVNVVGTIALGDAAAPGAARLAELRATLAEDGVACIFPEVNHSSRHAEMLVEGTATRLGGTLDPEGVMFEPGPDLYGTMMRDLAEQMVACVTEG